ncbi:MAG: biotin--[acetyl-CoA-carboxylase] ligase [Thermoanaerobaculia bacterium]
MPAPAESPDPPRRGFPEFSRRLLRQTHSDPGAWVVLAQVDSTNSMARRYLERLGEDAGACCFVAWEQTAGRGRRGRTWASAPGLGLYMTLVVPQIPQDLHAALPLLVVCGLARVVEDGLVPDVCVKWPNDLLSSGRKLAGVLVDTISRPGRPVTAIVGIGLNVHHRTEELPLPSATSLDLEGAPPTDLADLAWAVRSGIGGRIEAGPSVEAVVEEVRRLTCHREGDRLRCVAGAEVVEGRFAGFDAEGCLQLESANGTLTIRSSEILEE